MSKIDQAQSQLDAVADARAELDAIAAACRSACLSELQALAKECSITIKPLDLKDAENMIDDLIDNITHEARRRLYEDEMDASQSLGNELRSQGVE